MSPRAPELTSDLLAVLCLLIALLFIALREDG
jgi:hypothetical protein